MNQLRQLHLSRFKPDATSTVGAVFLAFGLGVVLGGYLMTVAAAEQSVFTFIKETYSNFGIEMVSIAVTVIVIDRLNRRRDERRDLRQLQEQLVRDAGSLSNEAAKNAIHQLRRRGWLAGEEGLLKGAYLIEANMQSTNLNKANMQSANLGGANLHDANLFGANMQDASLVAANLHSIFCLAANLQDVNLSWSNLQGADLEQTNLRGASLKEAILQNANLEGAQLDEFTTLPDDTRWTPDTDMTRFTDPNHPKFWRSDSKRSPAYRGDDAPPPAPK
jgi:Pentapeptide repeats (8 copies)